MKGILIGIALLMVSQLCWAQTPQVWLDYVSDKEAGITPQLTDYSYAGYHFSEKEIPSIDSWAHFDVTDYGAIANDENYDDDGIQAAIEAAQAHDGPAVVFFPAGRFVVSDDNDPNKKIRVSRDHIVLKGSGSTAGGTEIFMDEMRVQNGHWQFSFEPQPETQSGSTFLANPAFMGDYSIIVEDASGFTVGEIILLSHKSPEFAEAHFGDLELNPEWTRLFGSGGGMSLFELHEIKAISGKKITFKNPIQTDLPTLKLKYTVSHYQVMEEVGLEDILFTSNWLNYGEDFIHHKDDIHDYAWNAVEFKHVKNSWMRNCEFSSWSQVVEVRESIGVTIENVVISGKQGHASFLTRRGYGLLVKDCDDQAGQHHGPGTGYSGVNTVYLRCKMLSDQSVDSHSGQPYATLLDDVDGGVMDKNGGPYESYPHHGQYFTFWNYRHKSASPKTYDFWDATNRNGNTYAYPNFIGFQADNTVNMFDVGINQNEGQMVSPRSLFEAQLDLRLQESTKPSVSFISPGYGDMFDIGDDLTVEVAATDDGSISKVTLYLNDQKQRDLTSAPYTWGINAGDDPDLFNLPGGTYELRVEAYDNDDNKTIESTLIYVGQAPVLNFTKPTLNTIHNSATQLVVEASASDTDGSVTSVSLFLDSDLVSTLTSPPYKWDNDAKLSNIESGDHVLKLEAMDNDNLSTTVEREFINNNFPILGFTTPDNNEIFEFGRNVLVDVNASDADGEIEEIRLTLNGKTQRKETVAPYTWGVRDDLDPDFFGMVDGNYELKAIAVDDLGSETTAAISIVIEEDEIISAIAGTVEKTSLSSYPNPFQNQLMVISANPIAQLKWIDITGRTQKVTVVQTHKSSVNIETAGFAKGIYFIHVQMTNGDIEILKVVKE